MEDREARFNINSIKGEITSIHERINDTRDKIISDIAVDDCEVCKHEVLFSKYTDYYELDFPRLDISSGYPIYSRRGIRDARACLTCGTKYTLQEEKKWVKIVPNKTKKEKK